MAKIILRVDDCGWTPDKADDRGLDYFRKWRDEFGIAGLPVYYGFIPTALGIRELDWLYSNLTEDEQVAVHGWDHERGPVAKDKMRLALDLFRAAELCDRYYPTYIPPFNAYCESTLGDWRDVAMYAGRAAPQQVLARPVFFGGFPDDDQSLNFGDKPAIVAFDMPHLPAVRDLYDRAGPILERLGGHLSHDYPIVVTLHATWDANGLSALRPLRDKLASHLVPVSAAIEWLKGGNA